MLIRASTLILTGAGLSEVFRREERLTFSCAAVEAPGSGLPAPVALGYGFDVRGRMN